MLNYGVQSAVSKFRENQRFLNKFRELVSAEFRENQQFSNKYLQFLKENSQKKSELMEKVRENSRPSKRRISSRGLGSF